MIGGLYRNDRIGYFLKLQEGRGIIDVSDWEDWLREKLIAKNGVAVDVGAHAGSHTLFMAKHAALVIAIEPNPVNRRVLRWNCALNDLTNVRILGVAAYDHEGIATLNNAGGCSRVGADGEFQVPLQTLDSLLVGVDPEVIKVDVEGAEANVVRGAAQTIERCHPRWIIETHHRFEGWGHIWEDLTGVLRAHGYRWEILHSSQNGDTIEAIYDPRS